MYRFSGDGRLESTAACDNAEPEYHGLSYAVEAVVLTFAVQCVHNLENTSNALHRACGALLIILLMLLSITSTSQQRDTALRTSTGQASLHEGSLDMSAIP
jgi:uncharacterized membrane protein YkvI